MLKTPKYRDSLTNKAMTQKSPDNREQNTRE